MKTAVLCGGVGSERKVSLESGRCIADALKGSGLDVVFSDVGPKELGILDDRSIDIFFIALHGQFGEDGQIQQILEDRSLVYTGSGPAASKLAFDKMASKKVFVQAGVKTPAAIEFGGHRDKAKLEEWLCQFTDGVVVKPTRQGSSVGISIVRDSGKVVSAAKETFGEFGDCMVEEYIQGREITVGVLDGQVLPIIEIRTKGGFFDYHAKYIDEETEFCFDTLEEGRLIESIEAAAMDCFEAAGLDGFGRADFILSEKNELYVLEVNSIPGFTRHSLVPKAAARAGIGFCDLCLKIINSAMQKRCGRVLPIERS